MALPAAFLDELRARTPLASVIGRSVKLARSGRQMKGCCPFHGEKTPSFYVYDDGFHCFGCGAHGDAITFLMRQQGASFPEAVTQLAAECGLEVPKPTPQAAEAERRRLDLHGVLDAAGQLFARRLRAPEGRVALDYLRGRGIADATIEAWRLGWAADGSLAMPGASPDLLREAGLLAESGRPFFFNRVTFPIRDAQGRVIGFGGRTLGDGQPKYVNGPETALFAKRRSLFGLDRARAAMRSGQALIVVEGYLDVIALHQAGHTGAVGPLGTALTEAQLDALWRLSAEPVLCFDGDAAGARAAERAVLLALPSLQPDRSLRVANLPAGEDPDSLLRAAAADRLATLLAEAPPLSDVLFAQLRQNARTPEQRAAWRERLEAAAAQIRHAGLAREYRATLLDRYFQEARPRAARTATAAARTLRPALSDAASRAQLGGILLCLLLQHPALLHGEEETIATLDLPPLLQPLHAAMLDWLHQGETVDESTLEAAALMNHLRFSGHAAAAENLCATMRASLPSGAREGAMPSEALETFWHFVGLLRRPSLEAELAAAQRALAERFDEIRLRRVTALRRAHERIFAGDSAGL